MLSVSRTAKKDLVGKATFVKTIVKKTNSMLGYTKSNFYLLYKLRHCTVLCSSLKVVL